MDAAAFAVLLCYSYSTYPWVRLRSKALHNSKCSEPPLADFSKRSLRRFSGRRPLACPKARQGRITQKSSKIRFEKRVCPCSSKVLYQMQSHSEEVFQQSRKKYSPLCRMHPVIDSLAPRYPLLWQHSGHDKACGASAFVQKTADDKMQKFNWKILTIVLINTIIVSTSTK